MLINDNSKNRGSEWRRWDLHAHSPASYDYKNKSITNEKIIEVLVNNKIAVVAITDHHVIDIDRIQELQKLGKEKNITVLPGIECLSSSKGSEPIHFIGIFPENSDITYIKEQLMNTTDLKEIKGDGKELNEVYLDLKKTVELIHELGGLVSIHAGSKSNSVECITNSLPHSMAEKTDIANYIDIYELGKADDAKGYMKNVFPKIGKALPMILCSDNHNIDKYDIKTPLWIKAEPTFEGLKQIVYEPEGRVRIQEEEPECDKSGYNIVDSIRIEHADFVNDTIYFNKNLNVIVGGRSSGKSLFLNILAAKLKGKNSETIGSKYDAGYFNEIVKDTTVCMKNSGAIAGNDRTVDFLPQGYIHELVSSKKDALQRRLLRIIEDDENNRKTLKNIEEKLGAEKTKRENLFNTLYSTKKEMQELQEVIDKLPKEVEVQEEIKKRKEELSTLQTSLTEENVEALNGFENNLSLYRKEIELKGKLETQLSNAENYLEFQDFGLSFENDEMQSTLKAKYEEIMKTAKNTWRTYIKEEKEKLTTNKNDVIEKRKKIEDSNEYKTLKAEREKSTQYLMVDTKLKKEEKILQELETATKKLGELEGYKTKCINELCSLIKDIEAYYDDLQKVSKTSSDKTITIEAEYVFKDDVMDRMLSDYLHATKSVNKKLKSDEDTNRNRMWKIHTLADYKKELDNLCTSIYQEQYCLKNNKEYKELFEALLVDIDRYFGIVYRIYENDNGNKEPFERMSEGKQGIVFLKVLLEFEQNAQYPLLLDQPEDDLDNRSIYTELVQYIKQKKIERQIFIVTHNANVVLGTDAEHVIVANQHGSTTPNKDNKKFQYVSGAIENTYKDEKSSSVLLKKCIREHVCDILEGGKEAFKEREHKYALKATK